MQKKSDEGDRSTTTPTPGATSRIHQGTDRIKAFQRGVELGYGDFTVLKKELPLGSSFHQFSCRQFFISYHVSRFVLQGQNISTFLNHEDTVLVGNTMHTPPFYITRLGKLVPSPTKPYFDELVLVSLVKGTTMTTEVMHALVESAKGT